MVKAPDILERKVVHAGKVFIRQGEENARAYIIQVGQIRGFVIKDGERVEVTEHGPGDMIGEVGLMLDDPSQISYEAVVDTTVITVTRQDFEKKLLRIDKSVKTILDYMSRKLNTQDTRNIQKAFDNRHVDEKAFTLMRNFTIGLSPDKRYEYEKAILPHLDALVKTMKELKNKDQPVLNKAEK